MNELQKRFEEMLTKDNEAISIKSLKSGDLKVLVNHIKHLYEFTNELVDQLTWRSVEELPVYELDTDGICNELAIVKYNCGDSDNYAVATYEWINQNFYEVEKWLPIPKLGEN